MAKPLSRIASILTFMTLAMGLTAQVRTNSGQHPKTSSTAAANPFDEFQSFSALRSGGVADDHDRKIYRSGNLWRADFEGSYRITDLKNRSMWGVHPNQCVQFSAPDASAYPFSAFHDFEVERFPTNVNETVDGHACKTENVTFTQKDGASVIKLKLWEAQDLKGFPIRIEVDVNGHPLRPVHYTNVSFDPPDPKLFQHPTKCTEGALPGQKGTVQVAPPAPKQESTPPKNRQQP
jgi:hypothetical protein